MMVWKQLTRVWQLTRKPNKLRQMQRDQLWPLSLCDTNTCHFGIGSWRPGRLASGRFTTLVLQC